MIYVECKPDTVLARSLSGGKSVEHLSGKSRVCHRLMEQSHSQGMVDEDESSQTHPYMNDLTIVSPESETRQHDLVVYQDNARRNLLILLRPRLEEWVIAAASLAGVQLRNYGLPDDPEQLHLVLSIGDRKNLNGFQMLVQRLAKRSARVDMLAGLLRQ